MWSLDFQNIKSFQKLQLDIVGFLAILGEGSVMANSQVATLSKWFCIPRLLPAPQALLRPSRPSKLDQANGWVTGVLSGNHRDYINHVGNVVVDGEGLEDYQVKCVRVVRTKRDTSSQWHIWSSRLRKSRLMRYYRRHILGQEGERSCEPESTVKAKTFAPLTGLAVYGAALAVFLLIFSILRHDGMAMLATVLLSCLSSVIGLGNKWTLNLPHRPVPGDTPPGDVVIRYPRGSFLVVRMDEDIARQLYFAPENIEYQISNPATYRILSLFGTMMLMFGVIALGNSTVQLQIAFAGAYMSLNAAYWMVAALPAKIHWDKSAFKVITQQFDDIEWKPPGKGDRKAPWEMIRHGPTITSTNHTFTQALWKVIVITRNVEWVYKGRAAPDTYAWRTWLMEAREEVSKRGGLAREPHDPENEKHMETIYAVPEWNAQERMTVLVGKYKNSDVEIEQDRKDDDKKDSSQETTMENDAFLPGPPKRTGTTTSLAV